MKRKAMLSYSRFTPTIFLILCISFLLSGCGGAKTTVYLLPDPDGVVGEVILSTEAGSVEIDRAGGKSVARGMTALPSSPDQMSTEAIELEYAELLSALPAQPKHFLLYFKSDSTEPTPKSQDLFSNILLHIEDTGSSNISVVGHADTSGDATYNIDLSRRRAESIKNFLVKKGIDVKHITSTSHGENNPLIKTEDNVREPRNRRVEVIVR